MEKIKTKDIEIDNIYLNGIKNSYVRIIGKYLTKTNLKVKIDDISYPLEDNIILDKDYVVNRILKQNQCFFDKKVSLEKNSKMLKLYADDMLILSRKVSLGARVTSKIINVSARILTIFKRLPKTVLKVIKLMWTRHHFLIPPRMIKQYLSSFKNNVKEKNVDELFYNPLLDFDYQKWIEENNKETEYTKLKYKPLFSVIIPVYNVSSVLLEECLDSILNQSYDNFEICIADDNSTNKETRETLKRYEKNKKIKVIYRKENGHISKASNSAISIAKGEFIALVDNDDVLDKDALYYMALKLNEDKTLDLIYSDEDKLDLNGRRCFPHFKPDYSPDTLLSSNYFCHFTVIRKELMEKVGLFRGEYDGAQDYDLFLRITERTDKIGHISKVLYHWRMTENSTSSLGDNKNYAYDAGKRAIEDYFERNKIDAKVHLIGNPNMYRVEYLYKKEPLISIIIPTKDKRDVLEKCLKSIFEKTTYQNYEVIVVDNNSEKEETFELLDAYQKSHDNFKYITYKCEFNYSYLNNEAVKLAKGEYVVLLNNDTEVISSTWLSNMVGYAMQEHVGAVGVKLLYPNQTIQHSGVVIGVGGIAMHAFVSTGKEQFGYFGRLVTPYNWSCVTAACLMIKKSKYLEVKGLDENLKVAYNDVDFNLKLLAKGYYNVVLPNVELYHYESLSRGDDMSDSQIKRFKKETDYMCDKWGEELLNDRFYNSNLSYYYAFRLDRMGEEK